MDNSPERSRIPKPSLQNLNEAQRDALKKFKRNIPMFFLKTILMCGSSSASGTMRMRKLYDIDTIAENYTRPEVISRYEYSSYIGLAKNGSPVRYTRFGDGDNDGFLMSLSGYDIAVYCTYLLEVDLATLHKENERTSRNVHEITYVLDMEKFSLTQVLRKNLIETASDLVQMMQDHYSEVWGNIFIINAPSFFHKVFSIFKPVMNLSLIKKIKMAPRESTSQLLLKYIDADVLPAFLGGKRTDSSHDPSCSQFIRFGGKIPEEYFLRNRSPLQPSDPGVTSLWVSARSVYNYPLVIRKAPSRIHAEIRGENGSIGLKLLYRQFGDDPQKTDLPECDEYLDESNPKSNVEFASPALRLQIHTTPVDNSCNAPWPGIYIFRFDNTYSWFTSRRIIFRIRETKSDKDAPELDGSHET